MAADPSDFGPNNERRYGRHEFEAILGPPSEKYRVLRSAFDVREEGAWLNHVTAQGPFAKHPLGREARIPNPQPSAWLPFPFSARELAAIMVTGWGYLIRIQYGAFEHGPKRDVLDRYGLTDKPAGDALKWAYDEVRTAISRAPECRLQPFVESLTVHLHGRWAKRAHDDLGTRLLGGSESPESYATFLLSLMNKDTDKLTVTDRRDWTLLGQLQEELSWHEMEVEDARDLAYGQWLEAVMHHLLSPVEEIPAQYFREGVVGKVEPKARLDALRLVAQVREIERALTSGLCEPTTAFGPSDIQSQVNALIKVGSELTALQFEGRGQSTNTDAHKVSDLRARHRLEVYRRFGGEWVKKVGTRSGWGANDRKSGAFRKLVEREQSRGQPNSSEKSIRADLTRAAEAEESRRRLGI